MDAIADIITNPELWEAAAAIIGGFAVIATMTPNSADNAVVDFLLRLINFFGANVGKAENR